MVAEYYFGSANTNSGTPGYCIGITLNDKIYYRNGSNDFAGPVTILNEKYKIDVYKNSITINNDSNVSNQEPISANQTYSSYILARHQPQGVYCCMKGKVYSCEIFEDDTLVRNYVPCYRVSDGVIGLYDLVNNVFCTNIGTGTFIKGEDVFVKEKTTQVIMKNRLLPTAYEQVEYIESTAAQQYINTGYKVSYQSGIVADFAYTDLTVQSRVFGTLNGSDGITYDAYINGSGNYAWACKDGDGNWKNTGKKAVTSRILLNFNSYNNTIKYSKGITYEEEITTTRTKTSKYPLYIFARSYSNGPSYFGMLKLYSLNITEQGVKVRDFIPCYRKADNKRGLYDIVNDVFYTNQGNGDDFEIGPVIGGVLSDNTYVSSVKYFDSEAIAKDLGIDNFDDEVIIDFASRQIVSLNGIEYEGEMHYSQYNLPGGQKVKQGEKEVRQLDNVSVTPTINGLNATWTISGIEHTNGTLSYSRDNKKTWTQITNHTIAGEDVTTENITQSGTYYFKWVDNTNKNNEYLLDVVQLRLVNSPQLRGDLEDLSEKYNYSSLDSATWAYATDKKETPDDLTDDEVYVWIPRFAYEEDNTTNIEFLRGTSNVTTSENYLPETGWIIPEPLKDVTGVWAHIPDLEPLKSGLDIIDIFKNANLTIYNAE